MWLSKNGISVKTYATVSTSWLDTTTTHYSSPFLYVHIGFWILRIVIRPNCNNYNITIVPTTSHLSQTKRISSSLLPLSVRKFNITARPKDRIISIWMQASSCGASARRHMENLYWNRTKFEICLVNRDHVETSGCWEIRFVWASINICWYSNTKAIAILFQSWPVLQLLSFLILLGQVVCFHKTD